MEEKKNGAKKEDLAAVDPKFHFTTGEEIDQFDSGLEDYVKGEIFRPLDEFETLLDKMTCADQEFIYSLLSTYQRAMKEADEKTEALMDFLRDKVGEIKIFISRKGQCSKYMNGGNEHVDEGAILAAIITPEMKEINQGERLWIRNGEAIRFEKFGSRRKKGTCAKEEI